MHLNLKKLYCEEYSSRKVKLVCCQFTKNGFILFSYRRVASTSKTNEETLSIDSKIKINACSNILFILFHLFCWSVLALFNLFLQYVPPDLCVCNFVLEQSLSVRALQEMLASTGDNASEGVSEFTSKNIKSEYWFC